MHSPVRIYRCCTANKLNCLLAIIGPITSQSVRWPYPRRSFPFFVFFSFFYFFLYPIFSPIWFHPQTTTKTSLLFLQLRQKVRMCTVIAAPRLNLDFQQCTQCTSKPALDGQQKCKDSQGNVCVCWRQLLLLRHTATYTT